MPVVFGAVAVGVLVGLKAVHEAAYIVGGAILLKTTFSVRMLQRATLTVASDLQRQDLPAARSALASLVSRDTATLTPPLVAAAAIESVAENASDSAVAPWLAFALLGVPGALAYRAINTADAMIGYHGQYEYLGKATARLDDVANFIPARLTALAIVAANIIDKAHSFAAWRTLRRDHGKTASPNGGWPMSAMAGALMVQLEKAGFYQIGSGFPLPGPQHIGAAVRLTARALGIAFLLLVGLVAVRYVTF